MKARSTKGVLRAIPVFFCFFLIAQSAMAAWELPECNPPPLPLFGIEGYDGVAITYSAYLINPCAEPGQIVSKPNIGTGFLVTPKGSWMYFAQASITFWDRLALSYAYDVFHPESLTGEIREATGVDIGRNSVSMHNINARLALLKEGQFGLKWLPALTFGAHYKYNEDVEDIDDRLGGALDGIGIEDEDGFEFTLYASKMFTCFPRPVLLNVGLRNSEAAHIGLLGFTDDRKFSVEGNVVVFLTDRILVGAEYRQKPKNYTPIPGLVEAEDDWWSLVGAFLFSKHFSVEGGVFFLGEVLNQYEDGAVAVKAKYQF